jgi:hypothetical protein
MTRVQAKQEAGGIIQHDEPGHRHAASSVCLRQPFSRCCLVPTAVYSKTCQIACHGGNTSAEPAKIMIAGSPRPWTGECNKRVATARGRREHGRGAKKHFKPTATNLCAGTLGEKKKGGGEKPRASPPLSLVTGDPNRARGEDAHGHDSRGGVIWVCALGSLCCVLCTLQ